MKPHEKIHLRAEAELDATEHKMRHRSVYILHRKDGGGMYVGNIPPEMFAVCTEHKPKHVVTRKQLERVTCQDCLSYIQEVIK